MSEKKIWAKLFFAFLTFFLARLDFSPAPLTAPGSSGMLYITSLSIFLTGIFTHERFADLGERVPRGRALTMENKKKYIAF